MTKHPDPVKGALRAREHYFPHAVQAIKEGFMHQGLIWDREVLDLNQNIITLCFVEKDGSVYTVAVQTDCSTFVST